MFIFLRKKVEIIVSPFADLYVISIWKKKETMSREEAQQEFTVPWQETDDLGAFSRREKEH